MEILTQIDVFKDYYRTLQTNTRFVHWPTRDMLQIKKLLQIK